VGYATLPVTLYWYSMTMNMALSVTVTVTVTLTLTVTVTIAMAVVACSSREDIDHIVDKGIQELDGHAACKLP
jgi:hypothetical protein